MSELHPPDAALSIMVLPRAAPARRRPYRIMGRPGPDDRPALAAGHPVSWGLLTAGTVLDGAPYPFPVFDISPLIG